MSDSKVGVATTLSKEEQEGEVLMELFHRGCLTVGHPLLDGPFLHYPLVVKKILELEGKLAQAEAEKGHQSDEYSKVMVQWSEKLVAGEKEVKTLKEKLAGYEAAAPEVRALHAECQQVKARLHAFEQRYGARGDEGGSDIVHLYNQGIGHHRELEGRVADLSNQLTRESARLMTATEEKDEALREVLALRSMLDEALKLAIIKPKRCRKKKAT